MSSVSESAIPIATTQAAPPIVEIFHLAYRLVTSAFALLWTVITYVFVILRTASFPFTAAASGVYSPLSYVLSPIFLAISFIIDILVLTPYAFFKGFLTEVYPVYAFVVVTCIYAAVIGLSFRAVTRTVQYAVTPVWALPQPAPEPKTSKEPQQKSPKKVKIKEEFH